MSRSHSPKSFSWWADRAHHVLFGMSGLMFLLLILSPFLHRRLLDRQVALKPGQTVEVGEITAQPIAIGTLQVEVEAMLPNQRWASYEVQLLDQNNQPILSGFTDAWRESGSWSEDGESGTWSEEEASAGFDVRVPKAEKFKIQLSMIDISDASGKDLEELLTFKVQASQGTINPFPLLLSGISTALLGWLKFKMR
jgi:hypothetical protein